MTISIASQYTQRYCRWTGFVSEISAKLLKAQYDDDGETYTIWGYDGPEVFLCTIWKGVVPDSIISAGYTQEQNDADKAEFESDYKPSANQPLAPLPQGKNLIGYLGGIGTGDYTPSPNEKLKGMGLAEVDGLNQDGDGNLEIRGPVFTDEGSFRDDFETNPVATLTGTISFHDGSDRVTGVGTKFLEEISLRHYIKLSSSGPEEWVKVVRSISDTELQVDTVAEADASGEGQSTLWCMSLTGDATVEVADSIATVTLTPGATDKVVMWREADYGPLVLTFRGAISDRRANQSFSMGFMDDIENPNCSVLIKADGENPTLVKLVSQYGSAIETTEVTLPSGVTTGIQANYELQYFKNRAVILVNGTPLGANTTHLPDKYDDLNIVFIAENTDATAGSTVCAFDYVDLTNENVVRTEATSRVSWDGRQEIRVTPALNGARLRQKVFRFTTADLDSLHNAGPDGDLSDVTLKLWHLVNDVWTETTTEAEATLTTCDYEPTFNYEISGGTLMCPTALRGSTINQWFAMFVGVPDIPSAYGGNIDFVNEIDLAVAPDVIEIDGVATVFMKYDPVYHTSKLRMQIRHPAGENKSFQVFLKTFR